MDGKSVLKKLAPYKQGKQIEQVQKEYNLEKIVKLASNENPYGYSSELKAIIQSFIQELNIYPDGHATDLRKALATTLNVHENQLLFGNGSDEIVKIISRTFLYPGVNTVMATPTFPQYKHHALIEGAEVKEVPTIDGYHDLDGMFQAINDQTKVVWICSPDNPTGTLLSKQAVYDFINKCPNDILIVLDEAYYEYVDTQSGIDALEMLREHKNLILLRTFSKAYGLAGLRIGYGIMDEQLAAKLNVVRGPFNTTAIAQKSALTALRDQQFIQKIVTENHSVKQAFQQFLSEIGWNYYESQTNFLLVETPISGTEVSQFLLEHGFIIRPGELLGYPHTIRITIGKAEDMQELKKLLNKLHLQINNGV